ncbi:MAG: zf-HC2 domain-containing protein [Clostridiales Family XIII bacterium]|nr:zf-HC2 domain-containing protein [Clostridiales Family XIII bacterium]
MEPENLGVLDCGAANRLISDYMDGELDAEQTRLLERHMAECGACREEHRRLSAMIRALGEIPDVPIPEEFTLRMKKALANERKAGTLRSRRRFWRGAGTIAAVFAIGILSVLVYNNMDSNSTYNSEDSSLTGQSGNSAVRLEESMVGDAGAQAEAAGDTNESADAQTDAAGDTTGSMDTEAGMDAQTGAPMNTDGGEAGSVAKNLAELPPEARSEESAAAQPEDSIVRYAGAQADAGMASGVLNAPEGGTGGFLPESAAAQPKDSTAAYTDEPPSVTGLLAAERGEILGTAQGEDAAQRESVPRYPDPARGSTPGVNRAEQKAKDLKNLYDKLTKEKLEGFTYEILSQEMQEDGSYLCDVFLVSDRFGNTFNANVQIVGEDEAIRVLYATEFMGL